MSRKDFVIPLIVVSLLAGVVGYFLLRGGDDTSGMGRVVERAVEEGMAYDRVNVEGDFRIPTGEPRPFDPSIDSGP